MDYYSVAITLTTITLAIVLWNLRTQHSTQIISKSSEETITIGKHFKSTDSLYDGNFTSLTCCDNCKRVMDYWSNNSRVCEQCGGNLRETDRGKWNKKTKKWDPSIKFEQ